MTTSHSEERIARAALTRLFEPGDTVGLALVAHYGPVEALRIATTSKPDSAYGFGDVTAEALGQGLTRWRSTIPHLQPEKDLRTIGRLGGGFLIPGDEHWPAALNDLADAPVGLWYRGNIALGIPTPGKSITITGSRDCTSYGAAVTGDFAWSLAQRGITVVHGLGYGVDAAACKAALAGASGEGPATIAVVAGGCDRIFPSGHSDLGDAIQANGLLLSEMPPGSAPTRARFLARNRILAALAGVTCVVEARYRSAALNTARLAGSLGRGVAAVPGSISSANSAGCHLLLKDGAASVATDVYDLEEMLAAQSKEQPVAVVEA